MLIALRKTTRVINHRLASPIVLLTFLPTVAFARAAERRNIERVLRVETMEARARQLRHAARDLSLARGPREPPDRVSTRVRGPRGARGRPGARRPRVDTRT